MYACASRILYFISNIFCFSYYFFIPLSSSITLILFIYSFLYLGIYLSEKFHELLGEKEKEIVILIKKYGRFLNFASLIGFFIFELILVFDDFDNDNKSIKKIVLNQSNLLLLQAIYLLIPFIFLIILIIYIYKKYEKRSYIDFTRQKTIVFFLFSSGFFFVLKIVYEFFYQTILNWKLDNTYGYYHHAEYE